MKISSILPKYQTFELFFHIFTGKKIKVRVFIVHTKTLNFFMRYYFIFQVWLCDYSKLKKQLVKTKQSENLA